jgi:hypothetical protein
MRFQPRLALVLALVLALMGVAAPDAFGVKKKKRVKVNVSMVYEQNLTGTDRFYGVVSSRNPRCVRGASVTLESRPLPLEGGSGNEPPPTPVASGRADRAGNWQILFEVPANSYKLYSPDVPKRKFKKGTVICLAGFFPEPVGILGPSA